MTGPEQDAVTVAHLDEVRAEMRGQARAMLGIGVAPHRQGSLRSALRGTGSRWYPLLALGALVIVDRAQSFAVYVLGPEMARGTGVTQTQLAGLIALKTLALALAALPIAAAVEGRPRRAAIAIAAGVLWAVATVGTSLTITVWGLLVVFLLDGISSGAVAAVHHPLLVDSYRPEVRMRVVSAYEAIASAGVLISPVVVAVASVWWGLTWRGVFLTLGVLALAAAIFSMRLRDPGFGTFDHARIRSAVRAQDGEGGVPSQDDGAVGLRFSEAVRRILLVPTARRLLIAYAAIGMALVPTTTYLFFFLDFRWGLGVGPRSAVYAVVAVAQIVALLLLSRPVQSRFERDPRGVVRLGAVLLTGSMVSFALMALAPALALVVAFIALGFGLLAAVTPIASVVGMTIVEPSLRPHFAALSGIFYAGVGGLGGVLLLSGLDTRLGSAGAIAAVAVPGLLCAVVLATAGRTVTADIDRLVDRVVEREEIAALTEAGATLPLLSCRGIRFGYGPVEVLRGIDLVVEEAEIVALLGTNGAGKSTLLSVIAGLSLPQVGSVRLDGRDVTFIDAERRVRLGVTQVVGGRSVFDGLTVDEHLRAHAWTLRAEPRQADEAIAHAYEVFPELHDMRARPAVTLSGGQQQMLALTKALIQRPRLLCIDELSLGLAPVVVERLLVIVRELHAQGTSVLLVEQSVNVALSIASRAYFLEKGVVRFEGPAADLLGRDDLLRAVFLDGAAPVTRTTTTAARGLTKGTTAG